MARMHSRKKGKSRSTKPSKKGAASWVRYKAKEIEMLVVKLSKEGNTASKMGLILRDTYGIPNIKAVAGKSIIKILAERKLAKEIPEDLMALMKKSISLRKHLEANKLDQTAKRGLTLTDSKIKRIVKYYKDTGKLSPEWKFDPQKIRMMIS